MNLATRPNIILCGLQKSGKSTIGKALSVELNRPFFDTDRLVEQAYAEKTGCTLTCREIFIKEGQVAFRTLEKQQIASLVSVKQSVIALGGGSLIDPDSAVLLQTMGTLVYLKTPSPVIWNRIRAADLPAHLDVVDPEKSFKAMVEQRLPLYETYATHTVDTNGCTVDQLKVAILAIL